jgi:hypothetical protein
MANAQSGGSDTALPLTRTASLAPVSFLVCIVVSIALVVQFWALFRFRQLQRDMIEAAGGDFSDEQWTFGQIVAVAVFVPVLAEVMFLWKGRTLYHV